MRQPCEDSGRSATCDRGAITVCEAVRLSLDFSASAARARLQNPVRTHYSSHKHSCVAKRGISVGQIDAENNTGVPKKVGQLGLVVRV